MRKIRVGVIGARRGDNMIEYCRKAGNAEIVAVCETRDTNNEEIQNTLNVSYFVSLFNHIIRIYPGDSLADDACDLVVDRSQIIRQIIFQREHSLFPQLHGSRTGDQLGAGVDMVLFLAGHRGFLIRVGIAAHMAQHTPAILINDQIKTGYAHLQKSLA